MAKPTGPPYISDSGKYFTKALFVEQQRHITTDQRLIDPVFTYNRPRAGYIDGKATFVELGDPTGYKWALTYLGTWDHFQLLLETPWFPAAFAEWQAELKIKQTSDAIQKIREVAAGDSSNALAASKYIAEQGWINKSVRGRPSREELKGELKRAAEKEREHNEDLERIGGLGIITGGKT